MKKREHPKATAHGSLREVFDDVFVVTGSFEMRFGVPIRFSRNMVVLRQDGALTLVHSVRLDEAGLAALEELGKVEHVIRLAGFHGMDDPFYAERYGAKVWCLKGQLYTSGLEPPKAENAYYRADVEMDESTELPVRGAKLFTFRSAKVPEGILVLEREGGILITGDSLQNWPRVDEYFSFLGGLMMRMMGFIKPHNLGPGWLRAAKPDAADVRRILDLDFQHVLPVHGEPVIGGAKEAYRPAIERLG
ncbi:MAG: hypothetical protein U0263_08160 [Polyangiaceae bacterium]